MIWKSHRNEQQSLAQGLILRLQNLNQLLSEVSCNSNLRKTLFKNLQCLQTELVLHWVRVNLRAIQAVAAPTAGLHFSRELMKRLELKGIEFAEVTLHVGLGTFRQVEVEDLTKHKMDSEQFIIEQKDADIVNKAIDEKRRICAVGTTSMRAIESAVSANKTLKAANDWTSKFIFPPYDFSIANSMITNFHTSESTLLMMVSAFGGYENVMNAYEVAVKEKYRFYSYGDAMLII